MIIKDTICYAKLCALLPYLADVTTKIIIGEVDKQCEGVRGYIHTEVEFHTNNLMSFAKVYGKEVTQEDYSKNYRKIMDIKCQ